jgi:thioredoxin-like negative regulator of GroEL
MRLRLFLLAALLIAAAYTFAADNLRLNTKLDYTSDSQDGPLITGKHMQDGVVAGKPNYLIIYAEGCYNSKHQAQRTVELWKKYQGRVNFVIVDLDRERSAAQDELITKFYRGYIPHVVVFDSTGKPLYNDAGEIEESRISAILDRALQ